jgi:hypothetical protein
MIFAFCEGYGNGLFLRQFFAIHLSTFVTWLNILAEPP